MRIVVTRGIISRMGQIKQAVIQAEKKYLKPNSGIFFTQGSRTTLHAPTEPQLLIEHLKEVNRARPKLLSRGFNAAVLGAGLGLSSFTLAQFFRSVTGFEIDPRLCQDAEKIRRRFGIQNVVFQQGDFLEKEIWPFNLLYFYRPFYSNFNALMRQKLAETFPGTVIISHMLGAEVLFEPELFSPIYPLEWDRFEALKACFCTVRRK